MSANITFAEGYEQIEGGEPTFPPVITLPVFDRDCPLIHAGAIIVTSSTEHRGVVLAVAHPGFSTGFFMGMTPADARSTATWLLSAADDIDGGSGKQ